MSFLPSFVDERFLNNRLRSTSIAGVVTALAALALFAYRYYADHVLMWELFAVAALFGVVKVLLMTWYALKN